MGDTLRSILTRLAAYVGVVFAAGLLFSRCAVGVSDDVAKPMMPFGQMGH